MSSNADAQRALAVTRTIEHPHRSSPSGCDENRDLSRGLGLVLGVGREGSDGALPPLGTLVARDLAHARTEGLGPVLDRHRLGIGPQVVVPDRVLRRTAE